MWFRRGKGKGCVAGGCTGCLLVGAVLVVVPLVILLVLLVLGAPEAEPVREEVSFELPSAAGPPLEAPEGSLPLDPSLLRDAGQQPVELVLDLAMGSFIVETGPEGSPVQVVADFDASTYEVREMKDPDGSRYELRFGPRGGWLSVLRSRTSDLNEVHIRIPKGYPLILSGEVKMGQSRLQVGGLWLREVDLDFGAGDHLLEFGEPSPFPAERVDVEGSFGQLEVDQLGNASPRRARLGHSGGSFRLDLEGAWREDSDVEVECGFGDCRILRPDAVAVILERATVSLGEKTVSTLDEQEPAEGPTLRLWISSEAGDLRID